MKLEKCKTAWLIGIALTCVALAGCAARTAENINETSGQRASTSDLAPMRIVTDDLGRRVTIPTKIQRVVSLAPSVTESIFAVGAGDRLVGVTTFCNYPKAAKSIQKVGDTLNPNIETIVALKPDVAFVSSASQLESFMTTLEKNGITVYVMNPMSLKAVMVDLEQLGAILGTSETASGLVNNLSERESRVHQKLETVSSLDGPPTDHEKRVKVFVQISKEPLFTIGKEAFLNDLLISAGGRSVTEIVPSAFPKLSKETALALQPEAIILSDSSDNQEPNEVFRNSPAVKNGRVYKINADIISRPGPRLIDALEQIAKMLHPDKFQ